MNKQQEQLDAIQDIRTLMERSSKNLALSGLAGVIVGILAIACIVTAYLILGLSPDMPGYFNLIINKSGVANSANTLFLLTNFGLVLIASVSTGIFMSGRKAKKLGLPVWDLTTQRLLINMAIPLAAGGLYCLLLIYHLQIALVAPATLIFYGLALLNASKYTINDIRYLGIIEVATGLLATYFIDYGLLFWAFGFGILHIVYGVSIYFKYEK